MKGDPIQELVRDRNGHVSLPETDKEVLDAQVKQTLPAGYRNVEEQHNVEQSTSSLVLSPKPVEPASQDTSDSLPSIDFSSAPLDPIELAWWVAQQIKHFHSSKSELLEEEADEGSLNVIPHLPGLHNRHSDSDLVPLQITERERLRGENRERKKRWRESNAERSTKKFDIL